MNILLTGATGFIGSYLRPMLVREGHLLTIITRNPKKYESEAAKNQQFVSWNDDLVAEMEEADAVINLAGASIFGRRWTESVKEQIYDSRIESTSQIVQAIAKSTDPPSAMVSASASGYYGHRGDQILDASERAGGGFLAKVCVDWEKAAQPVTEQDVRLAHPRIAVVLQKDGGALQQMLLPFRSFLGATLGNGDQYFPWIHMLDLCRGLVYPLENEDFEGAYNLSAPNPVVMEEFANQLAAVLHRPSFFWVPETALKLALGEAADPILTSKRMQPKKLQQHGFEFKFAHLREALGEIL